MKILLNEILHIPDQELGYVKIRFHLNNGSGYDPLKLFKESRPELLKSQFWNSKKRSFRKGQIAIGFVRIANDQWLLFDISKITKDSKILCGYGSDYEPETLHKYEKYFGRLVIKYQNPSQNVIRNALSYTKNKVNLIDECEVIKILEDVFDNDIFPGYENVNLSWEELKRVTQKDTWKTALENQKGIYLICDTENGKMYVGSAYGESMILGRWNSYIKSGHGGNKELKALDFEHIKKHFRYSILEIFRSTFDDRHIIQREGFWKEVLQTRNFGYNKN